MSDRPAALDALLATLDEPRRSEVAGLDAAIRAMAPSLEAGVRGAMIGYGTYRYRYASGRAGDNACISIAARRAGISIYVGATMVERWADRLPGADCGKGCIRVKRASDLDPVVLRELTEHAATIDGRLLDWTGRAHGEDPVIT